MKVAEQVSFTPQSSATVQVTVVEPPHTSGATGVAGVVVMFALQPPVNVVVVSQVAKAASMAAWVWQAASVWFVAQERMISGAASTINVEVQVSEMLHASVIVYVNDKFAPSQSALAGNDGIEPIFVVTPQPPE